MNLQRKGQAVYRGISYRQTLTYYGY